MSGFSQPTTYSAYREPEFIATSGKARQLIVLAKRKSASPIAGSASRMDLAMDAEDDFNLFVAELGALNRLGHFGLLPSVKCNGIPISVPPDAPIGVLKHFSVYGWTASIVLDVRKSIAYYVYMEPSNETRDLLNYLTEGCVGP